MYIIYMLYKIRRDWLFDARLIGGQVQSIKEVIKIELFNLKRTLISTTTYLLFKIYV